ncbi:MAG: tetratricopeptide repeat protein [Bacteroidota bacterium]
MLKPKKKITKREMKQDKLVTTYFEAQSWFESNRKRVSSLFFSLLVVGIAIWFYYNNRSTQNLAATADLGRIIRYYDAGNFQIAVYGSPQENMRGLQQIVDEYGGTESGEFATFYLANAYFAIGDYDKALQYYEDADLSDDGLKAAVKAGIASCHEVKGNHAEAADYFEQAAQMDSRKLHTAERLFHAGNNYLLAGNKEKADEALKKLKANFPTSPYAREADRLLVRIVS